jgi:hypothetical protein
VCLAVELERRSSGAARKTRTGEEVPWPESNQRTPFRNARAEAGLRPDRRRRATVGATVAEALGIEPSSSSSERTLAQAEVRAWLAYDLRP